MNIIPNGFKIVMKLDFKDGYIKVNISISKIFSERIISYILHSLCIFHFLCRLGNVWPDVGMQTRFTAYVKDGTSCLLD